MGGTDLLLVVAQFCFHERPGCAFHKNKIVFLSSMRGIYLLLVEAHIWFHKRHNCDSRKGKNVFLFAFTRGTVFSSMRGKIVPLGRGKRRVFYERHIFEILIYGKRRKLLDDHLSTLETVGMAFARNVPQLEISGVT